MNIFKSFIFTVSMHFFCEYRKVKNSTLNNRCVLQNGIKTLTALLYANKNKYIPTCIVLDSFFDLKNYNYWQFLIHCRIDTVLSGNLWFNQYNKVLKVHVKFSDGNIILKERVSFEDISQNALESDQWKITQLRTAKLFSGFMVY